MFFKVSAFLSTGFLVLPAVALFPHLTAPDVPAALAPAPGVSGSPQAAGFRSLRSSVLFAPAFASFSSTHFFF